MIQLSELLGIRPGITAIIGSGGKTTLLQELSTELSKKGTVLLSTSTHIFPFDHCPLFLAEPEMKRGTSLSAELRSALKDAPDRILCIASPGQNGKLSAPALPWTLLSSLADYILVEADGSQRLPIKAHADWEPVIPERSTQVLCVVGAGGFGHPIREAVHRPELFLRRLQGAVKEREKLSLDSLLSPLHAALVLQEEALSHRVFLNQLDCLSDPRAAESVFSAVLSVPVCAGSLRNREWHSARQAEPKRSGNKL